MPNPFFVAKALADAMDKKGAIDTIAAYLRERLHTLVLDEYDWLTCTDQRRDFAGLVTSVLRETRWESGQSIIEVPLSRIIPELWALTATNHWIRCIQFYDFFREPQL